MFSLISITVMSKINFITNHFHWMVETFQQLNFFTNYNFLRHERPTNYELEIRGLLILL